MATKLEWTKTGLKLAFDVSAQATPRIQQAYPFPDLPIQGAQMLNLALETVAGTGRTGIRITSRGSGDFPGGAGATFSILHTAVQGALTATETLPVVGRTVNLLLDQALPSAVHAFVLQRMDAGQPTAWPAVTITTMASNVAVLDGAGSLDVTQLRASASVEVGGNVVVQGQQSGLGAALGAATIGATYNGTVQAQIQALNDKVIALETIIRAHGLAVT